MTQAAFMALVQDVRKLMLDKEVVLRRIEERGSESDRTLMTLSPGKNVSMMSYFKLYNLSLKLKKLVDVSCRDLESGVCRLGDFEAKLLKTINLTSTRGRDFAVKWKRDIYQYQNIKAILQDAQELKEHLEKVRLASREKAVIALSKALPFPREVLFVLLDKFVEVQDDADGSGEYEAWRIEEVAESDKLDGHGLVGQNFFDLYFAMTEIYEGLKNFRKFWVRSPMRIRLFLGIVEMEMEEMYQQMIVDTDEDEGETGDELDDDNENI